MVLVCGGGLGGGVGALCAAVALSEIDPKGEKYEITLYQLGWRLGGKCASGRNAEYGQRIEEHGLHIWAGFYDNAFTVMRVVCNALKLPLDQLFVRENLIFYAEEKKGSVPPVWEPWPAVPLRRGVGRSRAPSGLDLGRVGAPFWRFSVFIFLFIFKFF